MPPARLLVMLAAVVVAETFLGALVVGPRRFLAVPDRLRARLRGSVPYLAVLLATMTVGSAVRGLTPDLSWIVGVNATTLIYAIEGNAVAAIQSLATPWATAYFAFVYVFVYPFLMVFPFLLYLAVEDSSPLRELAVAFVVNDVLGIVGYATVVAYGPRNAIPELVDPLLFTTYPWARLISASVTANTNVFPSLHTSLAVTVALLAYRTREEVPRWFYLSTPLAASVVVSTMYLGIHWVTDVVAGIVVAWVAVRVAAWVVAGDRLRRASTALGRLPG